MPEMLPMHNPLVSPVIPATTETQLLLPRQQKNCPATLAERLGFAVGYFL
jgi:hypothetical protein